MAKKGATSGRKGASPNERGASLGRGVDEECIPGKQCGQLLLDGGIRGLWGALNVGEDPYLAPSLFPWVGRTWLLTYEGSDEFAR